MAGVAGMASAFTLAGVGLAHLPALATTGSELGDSHTAHVAA